MALRALFRSKVRDSDPGRSEEPVGERTVHWWRRAYPGHTGEGYPPVLLVVTGADPTGGRETIDDPRWEVRLIHADRWPKHKRAAGDVPELWPVKPWRKAG